MFQSINSFIWHPGKQFVITHWKSMKFDFKYREMQDVETEDKFTATFSNIFTPQQWKRYQVQAMKGQNTDLLPHLLSVRSLHTQFCNPIGPNCPIFKHLANSPQFSIYMISAVNYLCQIRAWTNTWNTNINNFPKIIIN